jgi:hypothetical protein
MLFKNPVRTSKRTPHFTVTTVNWLTLFKEIKSLFKLVLVGLCVYECSLRFTPGESTPGTHCTGGWVGPRAGLDIEVRVKILCLCRVLN